MVLKHECENCNSKFSINYKVEDCESDPLHCPFCGEYIFINEEINDEDEDY